jgi:hypothetical protein
VEPKVQHAMQTADGAWRVEIVKRGRTQWYRVVHEENVLDWLSIAAVRRILGEAGVDMANLREAAA